MTRRRWWWVGILMMTGALGGCGDHDHHRHHHGGCRFFQELEPNTTALTAQELGDLFEDDCFVVDGNILGAADQDHYRVFIQESLTLEVTLDHSPLVTFAVRLLDADTGERILDCGTNVVPAVCVVPFDVNGFDIPVDVVVTPVSGVGPYTLTLRTR
jgi:hypothetical protein